MDIRNSDLRNNNSVVTDASTVDINVIIDQRNRLVEILMQKDAAIQHLLSSGKLDVQSSEVLQPTNVQTQQKKQIETPIKTGFEHLVLQCGLLKDINESLKNENQSLKTVNRTLRNNYEILKGRLEKVQREYKLGVEQLHSASRLFKRALGNDEEKRIAEQGGSSSSLEPQSKKRRYVDDGSEIDEDVSNCDDDEEDDDEEHDLEIIEQEPVIIQLDDSSESEVESESSGNNGEYEDTSIVDSESESFVKRLSEYNVTKKRRVSRH